MRWCFWACPGWTCPPNGELAFDAPWQGTVFALAAAIIEHAFGRDREPFRQQLIRAIAAEPGAGNASRLLFSFYGRAGIEGSLALLSSGPFETGRIFTGTWQTLSVILGDCGSYLRSAAPSEPSCAFYWS